MDVRSNSFLPTGNVIQRRIFIGPMPESVLARIEGQSRRSKLTIGSMFSLNADADQQHHRGDRSEEVTRLLKDNAFNFFLHEGGNADDWREGEEQDMVDELVQRWEESEWGQLWRRRLQRQSETQPGATNRWFGTSFEVGTLLGVDILQSQAHLNTSSTLPGAVATSGDSPTTVFETAPSTIPQGPETVHIQEEMNYPVSSTPLLPVTTLPTERDPLHKAQSEVLLNRPSVQNDGPKFLSETFAGQSLKANVKGKAKVHYSDTLENLGPSTPGPAPPEEVLERTKATVDPNTSLAATIVPDSPSSPTSSEFRWGDVVLRDRMLVRIDYTKSEGIIQFDDNINRMTRNLEYRDWGEFLVVWRKDSIEIYNDYTIPGREWTTGHKQLVHVIPLNSSRTRLSLYSFVDLTFCITCAPTTSTFNENATRWTFSHAKDGTDIFVFKLRSRSRAYDWYWQLWRQKGGHVPRSVHIYNPCLNTKVTIDVPESPGTSSSALYKVFRRDNIIQLCLEALHKVPDYNFLMEKALRSGKSPQLAWRFQANLDWVWLDEDVFGNPRDWSVLCGLAFTLATRTPILEIRLAEHAPDSLHAKDGKKVEEPPAIEGYLDRIRSYRQTKRSVYLVSHSGYLFFLNPAAPFPPSPPGPSPTLSSDAQTMKHIEIRRGINQILTSTGMMDLRSIVAVRRAFQHSPPQMHGQQEEQIGDSIFLTSHKEERSLEDDADEGGEAVLTNASDRPQVRMRRSFELLLTTGHVMRFEGYSSKVAIEWIERLRALIFYWKRRHRNDAKQEIEIAQAQRPRLTPLTRVCQDEQAPPENNGVTAPYTSIDILYNWCILEGCKPIVKGGRIYMKKGLRGQYELVQLLLVAGHLVYFRIGHSTVYPSMRKKINLLEAYVCSGYFAAQTLPQGQYNPNAPPAPRRYGDGLETDDREEDMLFMIWYRPHLQMLNADQDPTTSPVDTKTSSRLSKKLKVLIFKTRSVLERDTWCWAINSEIEKIMRTQTKREAKLRDTGNVVKLAT